MYFFLPLQVADGNRLPDLRHAGLRHRDARGVVRYGDAWLRAARRRRRERRHSARRDGRCYCRGDATASRLHDDAVGTGRRRALRRGECVLFTVSHKYYRVEFCLPFDSPPPHLLFDFEKAYLDGPLGATHYVSGDAGRIDAEGYVHVMARTDDVLNVAGHRLSSGALEEALLGHRDVVEAAVIGPRDDLKGSVPVGLVVLGAHSGGAGRSAEAEALIVDEIVALVRSTVGAVAAFKQCAVVAALPKTRSGKILRGAMTAIANGDEYTLPGTIEDSEVIPSIAAALAALQYPPEEQGGGGDEE